ncbi:D-ribose pyranase [Kiloniella majae]|uniref:D-ribose pyranase n=1 Tax=Kiloniella majae TaxID=1938558 RepID=UPI000A2785CD|nr:D-ribose pyranase [Kiloniella majae]
MKRRKLLNRHLSALIASLGHFDEIVVTDAGLPAPKGVEVIDLAIIPGLPRFYDVLRALRSELIIEEAIYAREIAPTALQEIKKELDLWASEIEAPIISKEISHEELKQRTAKSKAIIRTGEVTPYANIILVSGVAF